MSEQPENICANCHSFFPDSFDLTDLGICLSDPAFAPYLDELLDKGNFAACRELIAEKRFPGDRQACPEYDEVEFIDVEDEDPEQLFEGMEKIDRDAPSESPKYSFRDHSFAWLLEHDDRLRDLRQGYRRQSPEQRRLTADYEYHSGTARELFNRMTRAQEDPTDLPSEVVALAINPEYAPALLTVGTHEYLLGRAEDGMELLMALTRLPPDTEDLAIIIGKAGDFLVLREDYPNGLKLFQAAAAKFPAEELFQEGLSFCEEKIMSGRMEKKL